ncbi:sortase [Peptoniphilus catoniae]|uniref:sortase n=1 Tax=Peptoniphilus catoniae TaxID=1660341 RepID=UPI0015D5C3DD|nr:sortase [Peptoniphilus catoniae]
MRNRKVIFGYILILVGILLPLYAFLGLSRGIVLDKSKYDRFMKSDVNQNLEEEVAAYNESLGDKSVIVDPFVTEDYVSDYSFMEDPDAVFCYLKIPKLDLTQPVYLDASNKHMAMGVGHIEGTDLPSRKKGIRTAIAGHRGYYDAIMFLHLDELVEGDRVFLEWQDKSLEYKVYGKEIIDPWDWQKLNPVEDKNILTLLTCDPLLPPRPKRLLVNAELVEEDKEALVVDSEPEEKVSVKVKRVNNIILATTGVLALAFCISLFKFIIYLKKGKSLK